MNLQWFADKFFPVGGADLLRDLDDRASRVPDSATLPLFIPHMSGRVSPNEPDLRGAFVGLDRDHGPVEMYRAVLEGVALEYGLYKRVLQQTYPTLALKEIRVTGGGAKSATWNGIKSAVLGLPVATIEHSSNTRSAQDWTWATDCGRDHETHGAR